MKQNSKIKYIIAITMILIIWYLAFVFSVRYAINNWYTNSASQEIVIKNENKYLLSDKIMSEQCVKFIVDWVENRSVFYEQIHKTSEKLWLDVNIVLSAILWEQIRISCKWIRWDLKNVIMYWTPTLFRSHNISVGLAWIKVPTALAIKREAIAYWYWDELIWELITEQRIIDDDVLSAKLATYLVQNIIHRWWLEWYDISMDAWFVWTLYNMRNHIDKKPHNDPKIWWAVIYIWWIQFVYWEISLWLFNYLNKK